HWLRRTRKNSKLNYKARIDRWRRWYRPIVEQLESRLAPGSVVVAISELLHGGPDDPYAEVPAVAPPFVQLPERVSRDTAEEQSPWTTYVAPEAPPLPSTAGQDIFATPEKQEDTIVTSTSDAVDWHRSVFDDDLFRAMDDFF